ncbi:MAG: protein phosphatase 2C domain-containing protein, partial [Deltaproteobacteria bacterium]|nr:protein phosphatase 2C domain-containing protein [Deltaproteobacteria bacterium]
MNTISRTAAASVVGARHLRGARNGQDAAAVWMDAAVRRGAAVVCDGCSSGGSSEVGARLGAQLALAAIAEALRAGEDVAALWDGVRARVAATLDALVGAMPAPREDAVREHLLFTIVAAAWSDRRVAVWALGDGGYALGDRVTVLGPFPDNQPPYLGYDLLGMAQPAPPHLAVADAACGGVIVATDGAAELGLAELAHDRFFANPDA